MMFASMNSSAVIPNNTTLFLNSPASNTDLVLVLHISTFATWHMTMLAKNAVIAFI